MQQDDNKKLPWTGERYVPEQKGNIQLEHLHRYAMACEFVKDKVVLDIACGEGYGSMLLSYKASYVIGVDISEEVIDFARAKYNRDNISFKTGKCDKIPLEDSSVDVVVSFETIEHHDQHEAMMREIKRILRPNGLLIISSPDKYAYSDLTGNKNQYHIKELYYEEFKNLLEKYFCNVVIYGQRILFGSGIFSEKQKSNFIIYDIKEIENETFEKARFNGMSHPVYSIAIASDSELPPAISSMMEQPLNESEAFNTLSNVQTLSEENNPYEYYQEVLHNIYISRSWRYTAPLRSLGRIVRRGLKIMHQVKDRKQQMIKRKMTTFPESALAHKYCIGEGLEIGGSAHNPFGLNTLNVDLTDSMDTVFKKEEIKNCGKALKVDIVANGDEIPLPDESQDFVVSSHVVEHFPNPIKALIEWDRLVKPGGIIFMIVPHKERTFDKKQDCTSLEHLIDDYRNNTTQPHIGSYGHDHCWTTQTFTELIDYMIRKLHMKWELVEVQDKDDKVGNGFTIVIRKIESQDSKA